MTIIGLIGTSTINTLFKRVVCKDYEVIDLDYPRQSYGSVMNRLMRLVYFWRNVRKVDVVYFTYIRQNSGMFARIANLCGKKVIYHWAGSDVLEYTQNGASISKWNPHIDLHLAYAPNLQEELKGIGIVSEVLPIVPDMKMSTAKMPEKHSVLLCIPDDEPGRAEFYGYNELIQVIQRFPELPFHVVRSSHPENYPYANVIHHGILTPEQMEKLYDDISIVIRFPKHDGLSLLLMESTIKGKRIIYNFDLPYSVRANNVEQLFNALNNELTIPPHVDEEASAYGIINYSQKKCLCEIRKHIDSILGVRSKQPL